MSSRSTGRPSLCYHPRSRSPRRSGTPVIFPITAEETSDGWWSPRKGKGGEGASAAEGGLVSREGCPLLLVQRLMGEERQRGRSVGAGRETLCNVSLRTPMAARPAKGSGGTYTCVARPPRPFPGFPPPPSVVRHLVRRAGDGSSVTVPSAGCHCQARVMRRRGTRGSTCVFGEGETRVWSRTGSWGWRHNGRRDIDTMSFGEWCGRSERVWYGASRDGDVCPFVTRGLGLVLSVRCAAAETFLDGTLMTRAANRGMMGRGGQRPEGSRNPSSRNDRRDRRQKEVRPKRSLFWSHSHRDWPESS